MANKNESTNRLEAFSDGVMAVIITIMVLDLKVPREEGVAGLRAILPTLLVYLLSFGFTGIYWVNHDHLLKRIEKADRVTIYANLAFLFWLSLLPFFTNYVLEKREDSFSVAIYSLSMMMTALSFYFLRLGVVRQLRYFGELDDEDTRGQRWHFAMLSVYIVSMVLAYWHPYLAMVLTALVAVPWILPNLAVPDCPPASEVIQSERSLQDG
jgi:uncharacterized membrane protein